MWILRTKSHKKQLFSTFDSTFLSPGDEEGGSYFIPNLPIHGYIHQDDLRVQTGPEDATEFGGFGWERGRHLREVDHLVLWGIHRGRLEGGRHCE